MKRPPTARVIAADDEPPPCGTCDGDAMVDLPDGGRGLCPECHERLRAMLASDGPKGTDS